MTKLMGVPPGGGEPKAPVYRCVATSVEGFIQQLAVAYITHGYWFYVTGDIPEQKDPEAVDVKLIERYGMAISKWTRCRRKKQGLANMQYLRHERFFVLIATKGRHEFFERERDTIRDVRRVPIKFAGYSIGCRKGKDGRWHVSVRIEAVEFAWLKSVLVKMSMSRRVEQLETLLGSVLLKSFAPVRLQMIALIRAVDRKRKISSLLEVSTHTVCPRRIGHRASITQKIHFEGL